MSHQLPPQHAYAEQQISYRQEREQNPEDLYPYYQRGQEVPTYRPEDYEEYPDFPQSMLELKGMTRSFTFKKGNGMVTLDDPNTSDSPEMVMNYYSNFYPELTTATVHGPVIKEDKAVYEFKTTIGTKG